LNWSERSVECAWHPYTQMAVAPPPIAITHARDALLFADDGNSYIDAISSWWVTLHGHSNPIIADRVYSQLRSLEHVMFAGFTHKPAVELSERLLGHMPSEHSRVFFSDNGSTAVEVALKIAIQYWHNRGRKRNTIVALEGAYHGDTFGAMSVSACGPFVEPFRDHLFDVRRVPPPTHGNEERALSALEGALAPGDVAAFIFEPLVQGAAGMVTHPPEALAALISKCHDAHVLTIADEVMTGFGRTGTFLAMDQVAADADIICLSKGLTGGTLPMAATTCTREVYAAFDSDDRMKTFFHGHSYTANPVGCAAALANLDIMETDATTTNIRRIETAHREALSIFESHAGVRDVRLRGTILAVEVAIDGKSSYFADIRDRLYDHFIAQGVLLRPLGNVVYVIPPYCITEGQLDTVYEALLSGL